MTYCVGWQTDSAAFLVADAAVTKSEPPRQTHSTFGELHPRERDYSVEEAALKIYRWSNLALTCAGSATAIHLFARAVELQLQSGKGELESIIAARRQLTGVEQFEGIAALVWNGLPQLFRLDESGIWASVKREHAVHIGSPARRFKQFVHDTIIEVVEDNQKPEVQLACVLATCQSLTVHEYLLAEKAGGAFAGVMLDHSGTRWHPDIGYLLIDPSELTRTGDAPRGAGNSPYITCLFRHDVLFVNSPITRHITALLTFKKETTTLEMVDQINLGLLSAHEARINCRLDFAILMSKHRPIVAVVGMGGRNTSGHLKLGVARRLDGQEVVSADLSPTLGNRLQGIGVPDGVPHMVLCAT